jgi:hypothetical protein
MHRPRKEQCHGAILLSPDDWAVTRETLAQLNPSLRIPKLFVTAVTKAAE